ncbi:MAG: putative membrane-bound redox modulator Alx [Phycisphaerae bacterium]|nr:putative membrane-bound redox modulator Alx [Phycisphaerae bacterium]
MLNVWMWIAFGCVIAVMLVLDLGLFNRRDREVSFRTALLLVGTWIALALGFNAAIWHFEGGPKALEFLTGYLIEYSLSMDNVFVFLLIFSYFRVPPRHQHRALSWGIVGALAMRAIMILAGVVLIRRFEWILYLFGVFLVIVGVRMAIQKNKEIHPDRNPILRLFRRLMPVATDYDERGRFFIRRAGRLMATPLLVVVLVIETTDVLFAVDSIPAIFAITRDPFIIYTSNVFAICGLRSLYFVLAGMMRLFHRLHYGLAAILVFVGAKMLLANWVHVPIPLALGVIIALLGGSIVASLIWPARHKDAAVAAPSAPDEPSRQD